jgi:multicomponent Na+:H+ antiporter subunit F
MSEPVIAVLNVMILFMVLLLPFGFYRVWIGRGLADRLLAIEMVTSLLIGISILVGLLANTNITIDVGIVLAALGFAGTLSVARYIAEGRVF